MDRFKNWLKNRGLDADEAPPVTFKAPRVQTPVRPKKVVSSQAAPNFVKPPGERSTRIEDAGPGKTVLIRNKYVREDTGTHETLKILDESLIDSGEETGIDPYNTGGFDRSKNWNNRFRK
ncbi:MAG TPA: hypothetical protein PKH39_12265 [Woeseiaceae bacterium]|nr:hypothetical protein [Woeseiaceae bacterium]